MASQQTSSDLSSFKQRCLLTVCVPVWVRNLDEHSPLHVVSSSLVAGGRPPVEATPQEREAASHPVKGAWDRRISVLPHLEIHRPAHCFTEVTSAVVQAGHSGTMLLGQD